MEKERDKFIKIGRILNQGKLQRMLKRVQDSKLKKGFDEFSLKYRKPVSFDQSWGNLSVLIQIFGVFLVEFRLN